jgi:hypothetical protein
LFSKKEGGEFLLILVFNYTCVPPSAAVALSRVRAISRWRAKTLIFPHFWF